MKREEILDHLSELAEQNRRLYEEALRDFRIAYLGVGEKPKQYR